MQIWIQLTPSHRSFIALNFEEVKKDGQLAFFSLFYPKVSHSFDLFILHSRKNFQILSIISRKVKDNIKNLYPLGLQESFFKTLDTLYVYHLKY